MTPILSYAVHSTPYLFTAILWGNTCFNGRLFIIRSIVVTDSQRKGLANKGYLPAIVARFVPQSMSSSLGLDCWISLASVDRCHEVVAINRLSSVNRRC